jgi:flagellar basal body-associated protein FliL
MKKKLIIGVVVLLVGGGGAYKMLGPKPAVAKLKIAGEIYVLPKGFTLNLTDGHYATTPAGFGTLVEEPAIRAIVTNDVTNLGSATLLSDSGRAHVEQQILTEIKKSTDVKVTNLYFTDLAIQ